MPSKRVPTVKYYTVTDYMLESLKDALLERPGVNKYSSINYINSLLNQGPRLVDIQRMAEALPYSPERDSIIACVKRLRKKEKEEKKESQK